MHVQYNVLRNPMFVKLKASNVHWLRVPDEDHVHAAASVNMGTEGLTSHLLEALVSHPLWTLALLLAAAWSTWWYIRDSCQVDTFSLKQVLITGCDSGFGNLLARQLDRKGFCVIAACLTQGGAADLASSASPRLKTLILDVTDSESIRRARRFVSEEVGERGLWGLVNNAGTCAPMGPLEWMHLEDFSQVLEVNLLGLIQVTLHFLPLLKKGGGRLVNVSSVLGRLAIIGGGYCPSKWGVEAFSDGLRPEVPGLFHAHVGKSSHRHGNQVHGEGPERTFPPHTLHRRLGRHAALAAFVLLPFFCGRLSAPPPPTCTCSTRTLDATKYYFYSSTSSLQTYWEEDFSSVVKCGVHQATKSGMTLVQVQVCRCTYICMLDTFFSYGNMNYSIIWTFTNIQDIYQCKR
ncbi:D-beta-hydroxybutyrate dehydrogenase, mitochondrial-like isoform X1 [Nerophis ophidion]|uniref:D-beta-hydroxybutyrate dehydrogenase, mitochondrial-like isoform X1 n=1 Tax=Nerophis ophidion TaxID=159077 RepID=UPI002ADFE194|nr:D-beta-hydroxybutyrate dehydrogenase, mitochondrial-like isoform X1 [Nerophis ophidion]